MASYSVAKIYALPRLSIPIANGRLLQNNVAFGCEQVLSLDYPKLLELHLYPGDDGSVARQLRS